MGIFVNRSQRRLRTGWRLLLHALFAIPLVIFSIVPFAMVEYYVDTLAEEPNSTLLSVLGTAIGMTASIAVASRWLDRRDWKSLGFRSRFGRELGVGFSYGVIAMLVIFLIEYTLGWINVARVGVGSGIDRSTLVLNQLVWFAVMVLVGFYEELLSRGYHLKNLCEGFAGLRPTAAIVLATLISSGYFGLLHAGNDNSSWVSMLSITLAGLMLAIGRIATGSLAAPIGLHISWNWMQGPVLGFPVSGNITTGSLIAVEQLGDPVWTGGEFGPEAGLLGIAAVLVLAAGFAIYGRSLAPRQAIADIMRAPGEVALESNFSDSAVASNKIEPSHTNDLCN